MNKAVLLTLLVSFGIHAEINVGTYNIRNFDYDSRSSTPTNKPYLAETLRTMQSDLLAVQEINQKDIFKEMVNKELGNDYDAFLSDCGGSHDQHLGFIVNTKKFKVIGFDEDLRTVNVNSQRISGCGRGSRPMAIIKLRHLDSDKKIAAIAVHFKSGGRPNHIKKRFMQIQRMIDLTNELKSSGFENVIVLGDFNTTEFSNRSGRHRRNFLNSLTGAELRDETLPLVCTSYWWGNRDDNHYYPSHLDHIVTGGNLRTLTDAKVHSHCAKTACETSHEAEMGVSFDEVSDHCPITIKLAL